MLSTLEMSDASGNTWHQGKHVLCYQVELVSVFHMASGCNHDGRTQPTTQEPPTMSWEDAGNIGASSLDERNNIISMVSQPSVMAFLAGRAAFWVLVFGLRPLEQGGRHAMWEVFSGDALDHTSTHPSLRTGC